MPKAQGPSAAAPFGDDEEKTTIEHGWEEEPSTTVEEGQVADKIRALGLPRANVTNITNTNASLLDEPTVDDQRANLMITPPALSMQARLVITGGNDAGQELTVTPGKSFTIGRAIDNDLVLTDITVSRKHFDLRYENGSWVLVDRGSGNGTLVNGNIEDAPFMLATGDAIEIGNTQFRIDIPNGPSRAAPRAAMNLPVDEDEPSTVASKPLREDPGTPDQAPVPTPISRARPKTVPPPPPRVRATTVPPPVPLTPPIGFGAMPLQPQTYPAMPNVTTPMRGSGVGPALRPPPAAPSMLGDSMGMPMMSSNPHPATTIPGQGPPLAPSQLPHGMGMYGYPAANEMPRQHAPGPNGQMIVINGVAVRDATSTALVPPTPYNGVPHVMVPQSYGAPAISRRMKLILGGSALTMLAAIATIAIIKGASDKPAPAAEPPPAKATVTPIPDKRIATPEPEPKRTVEPPAPAAKNAGVEPTPAIVEAPKPETKPTVVQAPKPETKATVQAAAVVAPKPEPLPPKPEIKVEKKEPKPETKIAKKDPPKREPKRVEKKIVEKKDPPPPREPKEEKKRVAFDAAGAKNKADGQYRDKNFKGAAETLRAAAKSSSDDDATDLNSMAGIYVQFGAAYNVGMAPGTPAKDAFTKLKTALSLDNSAGKAFTSDIRARIAVVGPKAAASYMAAKDYVSARTAVQLTESSGGGGETIASIRRTLEIEAGKLYKEAQAELTSNPDGAKAKAKQIRGMVDASSPWAAKAQKILNGGG